MKYADYMIDHEIENLGWCKPYVNDSGEYELIECNSKIIYLSYPDGREVDCGVDCVEVPAHEMSAFARAVNPDYDLYSGYTDDQIALFAMHPVGCVDCPCFGTCEAMDCDVGWGGDDPGFAEY